MLYMFAFAEPTHFTRPPRTVLAQCVRRNVAFCTSMSASVTTSNLVETAKECADAARTIIKQYYRQPVPVETKSDDSPVTIADKECEFAMRKVIKQKFPDHGIRGEEFGFQPPLNDCETVWVIDPIDGTKAFITGKPTFGTLISVTQEQIPIIGVIDQAIADERWIGVQGEQTTLNGYPIRTRDCAKLSLAYLYATSPHMFQVNGENDELFLKFEKVRKKVKVPLYGCDCYAYGLLSAGFCDVVIEASMQQYDYLALVPVVKGAGGVITDWQGNELQFAKEKQIYPGEVLATGDAKLHKQILEILQ
eukprot:TRINITY_DN37484_c0_g2_i2.p1 TRINITY_DN37484_c0_g2~~TRINITY_DN37484_c0_g2_i2.p1  ORF type:complete len:316 (-),score=37.46 TRINITY_DN37484_c0_g2_i2:541-1458(-)